MKVFVLGNKALKEDSLAIQIAEELKKETKFNFVELDPVETPNEEEILIIDVCKNAKRVELRNVEDFEFKKELSVHGYSIIEELLLLKKIGKVKSIKIIAIPYKMEKEKAKEEVKKILSSLNL
jgi:Ni,Fe-hydrogenase maturation factor